jgi:hypothetical protein
LFTRQASEVRGDELRLAGGLGEQLSLAGPLHLQIPPCRRVDRLPDGQNPVVLQDDRLRLAKRLGEPVPFRGVKDDAGEVIEDLVVFEERADILVERIEQPPK